MQEQVSLRQKEKEQLEIVLKQEREKTISLEKQLQQIDRDKQNIQNEELRKPLVNSNQESDKVESVIKQETKKLEEKPKKVKPIAENKQIENFQEQEEKFAEIDRAKTACDRTRNCGRFDRDR
ncbi:MAG: hypothetical protein HC763_07360 [Hydrococcus sp. CRU_1_1]|nr:hypothetical protein [Hydrococcus sp. CRU_1_1]